MIETTRRVLALGWVQFTSKYSDSSYHWYAITSGIEWGKWFKGTVHSLNSLMPIHPFFSKITVAGEKVIFEKLRLTN